MPTTAQHMAILQMNEESRFRLELAKYSNQRVSACGVLIDIIPATNRTKNKLGLVFASVNLPNNEIELDHVVIAVPKSFRARHTLKLYNSYKFTALVKKYYHNRIHPELKRKIMTENYQMIDINERKFYDVTDVQKTNDITKYQKNRLKAFAQRPDVPYSFEALCETIQAMPNNGQREMWIENLKESYKKHSASKQVIVATIQGGI